MKPLLFLDVDGVLNCQGWSGTDYEELIRPIGGLRCLVPPGTRSRVQRLLTAYEPVWATAWLGTAHGAWRDELGLETEPWPYITYTNLKLPAIIKYADGRPWAWVDDDAYWELKQLGWADNHERYVEGLIVFVDGCHGLTDDVVDQLLEFANG